MSDKSESPESNELTPQDALTACRRKYNLEGEGQWIYDVRARYLQLTQVTPQRILAVSETGSLILIGTAVDLYEMCRSGSVHPVRSAAIADAHSIVRTLATQQIEEVAQHRELDDAWLPTDGATSVADAKAALHFFGQTIERDWSIEDILSTDFRHGP